MRERKRKMEVHYRQNKMKHKKEVNMLNKLIIFI